MSDNDEIEAADDDALAESAAAATPTEFGAFVGEPTGDGVQVLHAAADELTTVASALREAGFAMLLDVTAVDYLSYDAPRSVPPEIEPQRFELVVHLLSLQDRSRVRVKVQIDPATMTVPSLFDLYPGSETMEREVFDMFGITFADHPDMTRVLMPEDWVGHPLRKDYDVGRIPVQFKAGADQ